MDIRIGVIGKRRTGRLARGIRDSRAVAQTRVGLWLAARVRVQHVMKQPEAVSVEAPTMLAVLPVETRNIWICQVLVQFLAVVAYRLIPVHLQPHLPANGSWKVRELTRRTIRIRTFLFLGDLAATWQTDAIRIHT